mmetsp:Transcript_73507/g.189616  ORF Transcript_73507/g.189616 Transcript_73507/m.189616 type:complete len:215 (+) Transcript_73507:44-688(+)
MGGPGPNRSTQSKISTSTPSALSGTAALSGMAALSGSPKSWVPLRLLGLLGCSSCRPSFDNFPAKVSAAAAGCGCGRCNSAAAATCAAAAFTGTTPVVGGPDAATVPKRAARLRSLSSNSTPVYINRVSIEIACAPRTSGFLALCVSLVFSLRNSVDPAIPKLLTFSPKPCTAAGVTSISFVDSSSGQSFDAGTPVKAVRNRVHAAAERKLTKA